MAQLSRVFIFGVIAVAFLATPLFVFSPNTAFACSCVAGISQEESFNNAKAVFSGRVLSIDNKESFINKITGLFKPYRREVKIQVLESWKGVDSEIVTVATGRNDGDCGFKFIEKEEYIIYAYDATEIYKTELGTGICNKTQTLFAAWEEVSQLGKGTEFPAKYESLAVEQNTDGKTWYIPFAILALGALLIFFIRRPLKRLIQQHIKND